MEVDRWVVWLRGRRGGDGDDEASDSDSGSDLMTVGRDSSDLE